MPQTPVTNDDAKLVGFVLTLAECRNAAYAEALGLIRKQTQCLLAKDLDGYGALCPAIFDLNDRGTCLQIRIAENIGSLPINGTIALMPLNAELMATLDAMGNEHRLHHRMILDLSPAIPTLQQKGGDLTPSPALRV
jgi:hypothetical protein